MSADEIDTSRALDSIEQAVSILMQTNRCDKDAAREILAVTARRNRLEEHEVAVALVALRWTPRARRARVS